MPAPKNAKPFMASTTPPPYVLFNPFIWLFWLIDFLVWLLLPFPLLNVLKMIKAQFVGLQSVPVEGGARRQPGLKQLVTTPYADCTTVHDLMQHSFKKHGPYKAMGTRTFVGMHKPEGAKFPLKVFGETTWRNYAQLSDEVSAFGRGLRALGMEPLGLAESKACTEKFATMEGPHCLLIFEETCAEWMISALGAMSQSLPVATSYSTLGMSAVAEAINQTNAPAILCNYKDVERVATLEANCKSLKTIIYTRNYVEANAKPVREAFREKLEGCNLNILGFDEVIALGNSDQNKAIPFTPPTPEHVGLIMYTSGSTGKPKGVMLKQSSIAASVGSMFAYVGEFAQETSASFQETYLAYLPAAHILEFAVETGLLVFGAAVGYSDPKTISSQGAIRKMPDGTLNRSPTGFGKYPPGGIQEFGPTIMAAVPKIWDILKKGVESAIGQQSPVVQSLFLAAFAARSAALKSGRDTPVCNAIFKKTYAMLGGRLKLCISGGGPLSPDIQNFIRVAFKVNLVQGYGLTETCAAGTVQSAFNFEDGVVGGPIAAVDLKLNSCLDPATGAAAVLDRRGAPYLSTDKSHLGIPCIGRGEVWIRGPAVSAGYYTQEKKTKEEFDENGWFHTGDIAIWTPSGQLKIVDRLKNLVKLKGGEYVAIESMEATYAQSVFVNGVNGGLMCYADGDMDRPGALIQVNEVELKKWADGNGIKYNSIADLCANPKAAEMVCKDLNAIGKGKLGGNEALSAVALLPGTGALDSTGAEAPWTPDNTYLTASNKLNRKPIEAGFASQLAAVKKACIR
jgi:long-chain acyl-CoA synthetase